MILALNVITEITAVMHSIIQGIFGNPGKFMMFAGFILVIIEREPPSVPSRTRQGNPVSPMVLWLKPRKSRSSPE